MSVVPPTGCGEKDLRYILFEEQVLRAVPLLSLRSFILVKTIPTDYRVHSPIMDFKLTNGQVEEEEPQVNELDVNRWGRLQPKVGVSCLGLPRSCSYYSNHQGDERAVGSGIMLYTVDAII